MTYRSIADIMLMLFGEQFGYGEVSERFKEPVLKTGDTARYRGFESHLLRQKGKARLKLTFPYIKNISAGEIPKYG